MQPNKFLLVQWLYFSIKDRLSAIALFYPVVLYTLFDDALYFYTFCSFKFFYRLIIIIGKIEVILSDFYNLNIIKNINTYLIQNAK